MEILENKKNLDVLESDENIVGSIGKVAFDLDFKNKQSKN